MLAPDPSEVGKHLTFDALFCPGVDAVHQGDQEVHHPVGDLTEARPAQRRQQGEADGPGRGLEVRRETLGPRSRQAAGHLLRAGVEEAIREPDASKAFQFRNFRQEVSQSELPGVRLQVSQQPSGRGTRLVLLGQFL